ncbi:hypothetical protein BN1723_004680 [Verticillium longisporum]|uniref:Zn(2)-C6 fungal-type domain-containing protein n=1 Tax=Verticillium longisporum TaxID=100787 RepID=A0A0G4N115_VERLO|nr:hypothetical protein BN1723_004680 [Verticillium longisporum]
MSGVRYHPASLIATVASETVSSGQTPDGKSQAKPASVQASLSVLGANATQIPVKESCDRQPKPPTLHATLTHSSTSSGNLHRRKHRAQSRRGTSGSDMDNGIGPGPGVAASAMSLGMGTDTRTDSPDQQQSENTIDDGASSEAALACNCCRKRKLRCSREVPTCQQCRKTGSECVYETKRAKPGMKAGAIENLHRRLDALERTVSQQASRPPERDPAPASLAAPPVGGASRSDGDRNPYDILSFFARELQRFNNERPDVTPPQPPRHDERRPPQPRAKRRRGDSSEDIRVPIRLNVPSLPDGDVLDGVLRAYFAHVHPWIPMIHEGRFRRRLADPDEHPRLHSLSRVNSYFLQQKVNMRDHRDLTSWLTRFKEMDLRLVHWKMFLPQKWNANMARQSSRMDPNLTLAHVTHNASMILLHQVMAFPPPEWSFRNRLPSILSEDTCKAAAMEIATITQNYLKNAPPTVPVSSAFAFCLYVAAKVLLSKWRYTTREDLASDFWSLVQSLEEMARRWVGPHGLDNGRVCLAAKYSQKLTDSYRRCVSDEHFRISGLGYTNEIDHSVAKASRDVEGRSGRDQTNGAPMRQLAVPTSHAAQGTSGFRPPPPPPAAAAVPSPTGPGAFAGPPGMALGIAAGPGGMPTSAVAGSNLGGMARPAPYHRGAEMGVIDQAFVNQQYVDMDRVISYDDGMFGTEYEGGGW